MSSWNNNAYSYTPGTNRLLAPVNLASSPIYNFQAQNVLAQDATQQSKGRYFYLLKGSGPALSNAGPPNLARMIPR